MINTLRPLILLLTFALSFYASANTLLDRIVAVVNDDIILQTELAEQVEMAQADLRQRGIQAPPRAILQQRVLDNMIMQTLQNQRAKQRGLQATDEEINAQLTQMAEANNLTLLQLREALNNQMPNGFNTVRNQIADQIVIQKLREVEVISQVHVTEDEIQNYLQRQKLQNTNEEYQLGHILITRPDSPTPEQRAEVENKVQDIYRQIRQGADFAQMAVRHSEGSKALNGGDLGWLNLDQMPSFFVTEVISLRKGQISGIIESPAGYHILKLLDKRSGNGQNNGQAQEREAIQAIRIRKANETFDLWMRRLRDEAFVEIRLEAQD
jgi:peptidyl-prolyl cis-trans isomerase SurA